VKKKFETPKVETKSQAELDAIIQSVRTTALPDTTTDFLINCIRLACWFPMLLEKQHITMRKLREMIFGKKKKRKKTSGNDDGNSASGDADNGNTLSDTNNTEKNTPSTNDNEPDTTSIDWTLD